MLKRIILAALWLPLMALAQSYPNPKFSGFSFDTNAHAQSATSSLQYLQGASGTASRSITSKFQDSISLLDFTGADPTDTTDSTTAFNNFEVAVLASGKCGHIPAGTYKITSAQTIDLASISPKGICIYGDGQYSTMLDLTSVSASPAFKVIDTGNAGGGAFYSSFHDFGIKGNLAGTLLQLGKTDFSDALNEFEFRNLWVGNQSTSASAIGIQVNYVLNTHFFAVIAANNGHGDAWQLNAAAFNDWVGGSGTFGDNGFHLTAGGPGTGAISGNTFIGIDHEVNSVNDVLIDTSNANGNTWIGGTFVYNPGTTFAFSASAGTDNTIISPMTLGYPSGTPNYANFFNSLVGVSLLNKFGQATFYGAQLSLSAPASSSRATYMQTNGSNRWAAYATGGTEPGSNAGSNYSISRYSDTGVFIDSPIGITRSTGLVSINDGMTVNGNFTPSQTSGIVGTTTNNNANAGSVGETLTNSTTGTSVSTNTTFNATSESLTAGDWDVWGAVTTVPAGSTTTQSYQCGISTTSITFGTFAAGINNANVVAGVSVAAGGGVTVLCPPTRVNVSSTTTVYAVANVSFGVSTMTANGYIIARRRR